MACLAGQLGSLPETAQTIRSSIVLPPNPRFEGFATEVARPEPVAVEPVPSAPTPVDVEADAATVHDGAMELTIHDLPLIRALLAGSSEVEVLSAEALLPWGYLIVLRSGLRTVQLHGLMSQNWSPNWRLEAVSLAAAASVEFTPSYVHAGSAVSQLSRDGRTTSLGPYSYNGDEGEWRHLAEVACGASPVVGTQDLIDDLTFALTIADRAADRVRSGVPHAARP